MLEQILASSKDGIVKELMGKLGLNTSQAGSFLQKGVALLESALKSGKLSGSTLMQGNTSGILSGLDLGSLTGLVGGDAGKARTGMESILTPVINALKNNTGGAQGILGQLTGGSEGLGAKAAGLAGKVFGKG